MPRRQWKVFWLKLIKDNSRDKILLLYTASSEKGKRGIWFKRGSENNIDKQAKHRLYTWNPTLMQSWWSFWLAGINFYHVGSRQCKRLDRVISIISFKTLHNEQSWRDSRIKLREMDALSWARRETQTREVKGLMNIPKWTGLQTNKRLSLSFPSLIFTHTHILTHICQEQSLYYICMLQNSLKAQTAGHHIILNTSTRQDDFRFN